MPRASSYSQDELSGGLYENAPTQFVEMLQSDIRGARGFRSPDGTFSLGGLEIILTEETAREMDYVDFPRNELMYFSAGGMRLIEQDGTVVEAGPGEMLFIPQGWTGKRIITGDDVLQKFSVVYTSPE